MSIEHMIFMNAVLYRFMFKFALDLAVPSNLAQAPVMDWDLPIFFVDE